NILRITTPEGVSRRLSSPSLSPKRQILSNSFVCCRLLSVIEFWKSCPSSSLTEGRTKGRAPGRHSAAHSAARHKSSPGWTGLGNPGCEKGKTNSLLPQARSGDEVKATIGQ